MTKEEYLSEIDKLYDIYVKSGAGDAAFYALADDIIPLTIRYKEDLA